MNTWKKWIILCCTVLCVLLTGCAKMNYTRVVYEDGSVKDVYEITFEKETIKHAFMDQGFTQEQADSNFRLYALKTYDMVREYSDRVNRNFSDRLTLAVLSNEISSEEAMKYRSLIKFVPTVDSPGCEYVTFSRIFETKEAFSFYNNLYKSDEEEEEDGYVLEDGFFFYRYSLEVENFYESLRNAFKEDNNVFGKTYEQLLEEFGRGLFTEDDLEVTQTYITSDKRLHSNADFTAKENGYYLQEWNISTSNHTQLKYFYYIANTTNWYYICAGVAIGVVAIVLMLSFLLKKKKKSGL